MARESIDFVANIKAFYDSETLSDVTIEFGNRSIKAHKLVLCQSSDYFKASLAGNFKEANNSVIHLYEDRADAVELFIRHLYGYKWGNDRMAHEAANSSALAEVYVDAYVVGKKYLVPSFRTLAENNLRALLSVMLDAAPKTEVFSHFVKYVYLNNVETAVDLRPLMVNRFTTCVSRVSDKDVWRALLQDVPEFAHEVIDALMKQKRESAEEEVEITGATGPAKRKRTTSSAASWMNLPLVPQARLRISGSSRP